jgi:hypothetical protein
MLYSLDIGNVKITHENILPSWSYVINSCHHLYITDIEYTEQVGVAAALFTYIRKVLGSNLLQDIAYPDRNLLWFSSVPPGSCQSSTSIRPWLLLIKSFPIHQ